MSLSPSSVDDLSLRELGFVNFQLLFSLAERVQGEQLLNALRHNRSSTHENFAAVAIYSCYLKLHLRPFFPTTTIIIIIIIIKIITFI